MLRLRSVVRIWRDRRREKKKLEEEGEGDDAPAEAPAAGAKSNGTASALAGVALNLTGSKPGAAAPAAAGFLEDPMAA